MGVLKEVYLIFQIQLYTETLFIKASLGGQAMVRKTELSLIIRDRGKTSPLPHSAHQPAEQGYFSNLPIFDTKFCSVLIQWPGQQQIKDSRSEVSIQGGIKWKESGYLCKTLNPKPKPNPKLLGGLTT